MERKKIEAVGNEQEHAHKQHDPLELEWFCKALLLTRVPIQGNDEPLDYAHVDIEPELQNERLIAESLQKNLVVHAAAGAKKRAHEHGDYKRIFPVFAACFAPGHPEQDVAAKAADNASPLQGHGAFTHEQGGHENRKDRSGRADWRCNGKRQVGDGVVGERPAGCDDGRLHEQGQMVFQSRSFGDFVDQEQNDICEAADQEQGPDGVLVYGPFFANIVNA